MNLKSCLPLAFMVSACAAAAQPPTQLAIPGTQCAIALPAGFTQSTSFSGFQDEKTGAFIMVNELPAPIQAVSEGFSEAAMSTRGMKLLKTEPTTVRGRNATLYTVSQQAKGTAYIKYLLIFGESDATTLVTAGYPQGSGVDGAKLTAMIRAIDCDRRRTVDPLAAAPFTLNTSGSDFKPVKFAGGSLLYSTDGKVPTEKPVLIAGSSIGKTEVTTRKAFAEKRLLQLPGAEKATIRQTTELSIDGMPGFEVIAEGSGTGGNAAMVYEVMLFTEDGRYYVIVGQANERSPGLVETYRSIAKSFKRK